MQVLRHFAQALILSATAHAWVCSLNMTGSSTAQIEGDTSAMQVDASISCNGTQLEQSYGNFTVYIDPILKDAKSYGDFNVSVLDVTGLGLVLFQHERNLTITDSQLQNLSLYGQAPAMNFTDCNVSVSNLNSTNCSIQTVLLFTNTDRGDDTMPTHIDNSNFSNTTGGTAVAIVNGYTTITNSYFQQGSATSINRQNSDDSLLEIYNCLFSDMNGTNAVLNLQRPGLRMTWSTFSQCWNYGILGMIDINHSQDCPQNETALVDHCYFWNNYARYGAIYMLGFSSCSDPQNPGQQLNVYNSVFDSNYGNVGGAMTLWAISRIDIRGCTFSSNTAFAGLGGALYVYGWYQQNTYFTMRDSKFIGNNATAVTQPFLEVAGITDHDECGGAVISSAQCVGIANTTFVGNQGTGLCVRGHDASSKSGCSDPYDATFFNRSITSGADTAGFFDDFLDVDKTVVMNLNILDSVFSDNVAAVLTRLDPEPVQPTDPLMGGAGLSIRLYQFGVLSNLTVTGNQGKQGSGLHLDSCFATVVWNSTFDDNIATDHGGSIASVSSHGRGLLLANSTVKNSRAVTGGAVYGASGSAITIANGTQLVGNQAVTDGGAVFCDGCNALKLKAQANVSSNTAQGSGGGLYCSGCILLEADDSTFTNNSADIGGAMASDGNGVTFTSLTDCQLMSNAARISGGAVAVRGGATYTNGNTLDKNTAVGRGGAMLYRKDCFTINTIPGVTFNDTFAWEQLNGSFTQDLASAAGNCSYFASQGDTFTNNHADVAGGILFSTDRSSTNMTCGTDVTLSAGDPQCHAWDSSHNTAGEMTKQVSGLVGTGGYGATAAFEPHRVLLGGLSSASIDYISDGMTKLTIPDITVIDEAGNIVTSGLQNRLWVNVTLADAMLNTSSATAQLQGQVLASADVDGRTAITDLLLVALPGLHGMLVALPGFPEVHAAVINVTVHLCEVGQVPQAGTDAANTTTCTLCPANTFSWDPNDPNCQPCPQNAQCNGSASVVPQPTYIAAWWGSPNIVLCPNPNACQRNMTDLGICQNATFFNKIASVQGSPLADPNCTLFDPFHSFTEASYAEAVYSTDPLSYSRKSCKMGYYGPLCTLCVRNGTEQYARSGALSCKPCRNKAAIIALYVVSTAVAIGWLSYTVHVSLVENEEDAAGVAGPNRVSQLIRAFNLWLQYITFLGGVNMSTPQSVHWIISAASYAFSSVTSGTLSIDCLLSDQGNLALHRILFHLAIPLLVLLLVMLLITARWSWAQKRPQVLVPNPSASQGLSQSLTPVLHLLSPAKDLQRALVICVLEVNFYYYPSIMTTTLSLFSCFNIPATDLGNSSSLLFGSMPEALRHGFWLPDARKQCFVGWHLGVSLGLGLPLLAITGIVIPLLPFFLLYRHRLQLKTNSVVKLTLGYLYSCYKAPYFWWNSFVLYQTLFLAIALVFAEALDSFFQLSIMSMILVAGLGILMFLQPLHDDLLQHIQVLTMSVLAGTALGCLYFLDPNQVASPAGLQAVGALLLIANVMYVAWMLQLILRTGLPQARALARKTLVMTQSGSMHVRRAMSRSVSQRSCALFLWSPWRLSSRLKASQSPKAGDIGRGVSMSMLLLPDGTQSAHGQTGHA